MRTNRRPVVYFMGSMLSKRMALCAAAATAHALMWGIPPNLQAELSNPGPFPASANSGFGAAVAATGKVVFVGAPTFDQAGLTDTGAVFAYDQKTGAPVAGPLFGSLAGTANFVGTSLAANKRYWAAGGPGVKAGGFTDSGGVILVVNRTGDGVPLENPDPAAGDNFGAAVALYQNYLVIGAPKDTGPGGGPASSGAAFLLNLKTGLAMLGLIDPNASPGDLAGTSVAVSKRYVVVGTPGRAAGALGAAGVATVFDAKTGAYIRTLTAPVPATNDLFGSAVAATAKSILVGSPGSDYTAGGPTVSHAGLVFEYDANTGALQRTFAADQPSDGSHFGSSLSTDGKLLIVGAPDDTGVSSGAGTTDTYNYKTGAHLRVNLSERPVAGAKYGSAVAVLKGGRYVVGEIFGTDVSAHLVGNAFLYNRYP